MTDNSIHAIEGHTPGITARAIFGGLAPTKRFQAPEDRATRGSNPTMPILLVSTMAMSLTGTAAIAIVTPTMQPHESTRGAQALASTSSAVKVATLPAPASYKVVKGDTVGAIAKRYGLSTSVVLTRNGLSASSLIYPGQNLSLGGAAVSAPAAVAATPIATATATGSGSGSYTIARGDTISRIASKYGISIQSVLTANGLGWSSIIYPGQKLAIPESSTPVLAATPVVSVTPVIAAAPAPAAAPSKPVAVSGSYVIQTGDNLTKIASKVGVSLQSLLDANGLNRASIIYSGRTLVVPSVAGAATTAGATSAITLLSAEQAGNAAIIISVGRELNVPDSGIVIALATAMQESSLRNIAYGHLDSVGLFQQRPSAGWGTIANLTTASHAARLFYGGPSNPNKGITRGLLDISGWQSMTLTQAAQKVQVSAFPNAYANWEASALVWFSELG